MCREEQKERGGWEGEGNREKKKRKKETKKKRKRKKGIKRERVREKPHLGSSAQAAAAAPICHGYV